MLALGGLGTAVAILSRKPERLQAGDDALKALGANAIAVTTNIHDPEQISTAKAGVKNFKAVPGRNELEGILWLMSHSFSLPSHYLATV